MIRVLEKMPSTKRELVKLLKKGKMTLFRPFSNTHVGFFISAHGVELPSRGLGGSVPVQRDVRSLLPRPLFRAVRDGEENGLSSVL